MLRLGSDEKNHTKIVEGILGACTDLRDDLYETAQSLL